MHTDEYFEYDYADSYIEDFPITYYAPDSGDRYDLCHYRLYRDLFVSSFDPSYEALKINKQIMRKVYKKVYNKLFETFIVENNTGFNIIDNIRTEVMKIC